MNLLDWISRHRIGRQGERSQWQPFASLAAVFRLRVERQLQIGGAFGDTHRQVATSSPPIINAVVFDRDVWPPSPIVIDRRLGGHRHAGDETTGSFGTSLGRVPNGYYGTS